MPDYYSEPFITLAGLTHKSAIVSWGAFYFRIKNHGEEFKLVDDDDLEDIEEVVGDQPGKPPRVIHPPRRDTIGATSQTYGPARVEVEDPGGVVTSFVAEPGRNHCLIHGLRPDTAYTYRVFVNSDGEEEQWASGPRRNWERRDGKMGLGPKRKEYENSFRTFPDPKAPAGGPFTFAVIGDFGVGVKKEKKDRGQRQVAAALERAVADHGVRFIITTGDNIYRTGGFLGLPIGGETGDEDDDWYFTYYQPYRYVINRVPVYPTIGNHDSPETEGRDDREQLFDNFYVRERAAADEAAGRASIGPGLFYRFNFGSDVEFICLDTSKEPTLQDPNFDRRKRLFEHPKHKQFLDAALPAANGGGPAWRIPFGHHPPFCRGPEYGDTEGMESLVRQFRDAGVRLVLSGHEHFFQHNRHGGVNYFVTGGAGKLRTDDPDKETASEVRSWAAEYHFLLITIDGRRATVRAVAASEGGPLADIPRKNLAGDPVTSPIVVELT